MSLKELYCSENWHHVYSKFMYAGHVKYTQVMIRDGNITPKRKGKDRKSKARVQEDLFMYSVRQIRQHRWNHRNALRDKFHSDRYNKKPHITKSRHYDRSLKTSID